MNSLHLPSALTGAALIVLVALVAGAQSPGRVLPPPRPPQLVHIAGIPDPNDMVLIREEDGPYTVPVAKVLVIAGLHEANGSGGRPVLWIDDVRIARAESGSALSVGTVPPPGICARAGTVVTLTTETYPGIARAFGYLADARP